MNGTKTYKIVGGMARFMTLWLALIMACLPMAARRNIYSIDSHDGLASMFVFSLHQDRYGFIWAGTYDGLSVMSGGGVQRFLDRPQKAFDGNMVLDVMGGEGNHIWMRTNNGVCMADVPHNMVRMYPEIAGDYRMAASGKDDVVVLCAGSFWYHHRGQDKFLPLPFQNMDLSDYRYMAINEEGVWTIVTRDNTLFVSLKVDANGTTTTMLKERIEHPTSFRFADCCGDELVYVDFENRLYTSDLQGKRLRMHFTLPEALGEKGDISKILRDDKGFLISFYSGGVFRLSEGKDGVEMESMPITCGVFSMLMDAHQPIVWVATDGEGVKAMVNESFTLHNELYSQQPIKLSKPIRAFYKDTLGNLWVATKGDGLLCYLHYKPFGGEAATVVQYTRETSALLHNSLYSLTPSSHGVIWIGSDGQGLNYVNPTTHRVSTLTVGDDRMRNVHDIAEEGDSLWVVTQSGLWVVGLQWKGGQPQVTHCQRVLYDEEDPVLSQYQSVKVKDGCVWLAARENGLVRWNCKERKSDIFMFDSMHQCTVNDVMCLLTDYPGYVFCATKGGLIQKEVGKNNAFTNVNAETTLGMRSVRAVHSDGSGRVWLSMGNSIASYDIKKGAVDMYTYSDGIEVQEFSECASYYDAAEQVHYFGGTNGFVTLSNPHSRMSSYMSPILYLCTTLAEDGAYCLSELQQQDITLASNQNIFCIRLFINDYMETDLYTFEYCLGDNEEWNPVGESRIIPFTGLPYGDYTLHVRYHKGSNTSEVTEIHISILPPWYLTWPMKLIYLLVVVGMAVYLFVRYMSKVKRRQQYELERLHARYKKAMSRSIRPIMDSPIQEGRPTIISASDDPETLWMLYDMLHEKYNILSCQDAERVLKMVGEHHIDLFIIDVDLEPEDGMALCRRLKQSEETNHIPAFLISADEERKVECMESGAQQFIPKPFDVPFFLSIVKGQFSRTCNLKKYYNSAESSFDIFEGRKLHKEDREMLKRMQKIITDNLSNPELSTEFVAKELGMSMRNVYRKLQGITDKTPKDFIREMRLQHASKLLVKTKLTIDEVCYQSGFNNRGTFYKLFTERFGCTPKQYKNNT